MPSMENKSTLNLTDRAQQVLADVVDVYAQSGVPVGSKALVDMGKLQLSPASIRNVMQDLEKQGLLTHPHTSAGRIPTEEGFRYFANNLVAVDDIDKDIKKEIDKQVTADKDVKLIIKDVSRVLGEITNCASLVTAPKRTQDPLEQVEFIRLSGDRVLVVMVSAAGSVENRIIEVPAFIDTDELNKASSHMKTLIAGQTIGQAKEQLIENLAEQRGRVNEMLDQMMDAANQWGQPVVSDGAMVVTGSTHLFQYPELVREKLQGLIKMFEEKRLLMALMDEVQQGEGVQVFIGKDSGLAGMDDYSIVASQYGSDDKQILGTLGVIGPMRMNYKHALGVVNYTGQLLSRIINEKELERT